MDVIKYLKQSKSEYNRQKKHIFEKIKTLYHKFDRGYRCREILSCPRKYFAQQDTLINT